MAINPKTTGVHHVALRCTDFDITKKFYQDVLGFTLALDSPEIIAFLAGPVIFAFKKANAETTKDVFTPYNIGLDHVALACETEEELHRVAKGLADEGVENTGVNWMKRYRNNMLLLRIPIVFNGSFI